MRYPPLHTSAPPPWQACWAPPERAAAVAFDDTHSAHWRRAVGAHEALAQEPSHVAKQDASRLATIELARGPKQGSH